MSTILAINGSPAMEKGNTAMLLSAFSQGMQDAGGEVETLYASGLRVKPCACNQMYCWYTKPGECCIKDDMQMLYAKLAAADVLVLATPVYIPLPGAMQNVINRLCPLIEPVLEIRDGRTRSRMREGFHIRQIVLVCTGDWWELANADTVVRIVEEIALNMGVSFAGAVIRPHALMMKKDGQLTKEGEAVLVAARHAGKELIADGKINPITLECVARPLISHEALNQKYNQWLQVEP